MPRKIEYLYQLVDSVLMSLCFLMFDVSIKQKFYNMFISMEVINNRIELDVSYTSVLVVRRLKIRKIISFYWFYSKL